MKKKLLGLTLALTLVITNSTGVYAAQRTNESTKITIIHTNDTHGRVLADDGGFGFGKIASIAKKEKKENKNTLLIDAGDTLHGKPIINISKGENAVKILDAAGYDYMTAGNHDFNYGSDRLIELGNMASKFKVLDANLLKDGKDVFNSYDIIDMDGVKVGIFGLSTPETAYKTNPANVTGVEFKDPIEVSKEIVKELDPKTDVIVAIAHIGLDESSVVTSKEIAEKVEGIDVIIDGHSHTLLDEGMMVNNTLIAQTGEYDKNLGSVEIQVKDGKVENKTAKLLKSEDYADLEEDKEVRELIENINKENDAIFSQVVASTDILLNGERSDVRARETNLGNITCDAVKYTAKTDIAFINGGTLRTSIQPGEITKGKLAELFPFGNIVQIIKITGQEVVNALEVSVGGYPEMQGGFLQASGVTFSFDPSMEKGNRVFDVKVNGNDIDLSKEYTAAINDFLSQGGDGYDMLKKTVIGELGTYEEIFADYLNVNGTKNSEVSGRIAIGQKPAVNVSSEAAEVPVVQSEPQPVERTYTVISGDNLYRIGIKHNVSWKTIVAYNNISNPTLIYPGQVIRIPA